MSSLDQNDSPGMSVDSPKSVESGGTNAVESIQRGVKKASRKFLYTEDGDNMRGVVGYGVLAVAVMVAGVANRTKVDKLQTQQRIEKEMAQEAAAAERDANILFQSGLAQQIVDEVPLEGDTVQ